VFLGKPENCRDNARKMSVPMEEREVEGGRRVGEGAMYCHTPFGRQFFGLRQKSNSEKAVEQLGLAS
jgi:hypothetical protein